MSLPLSVIGTGYLGVVHAACMADLGHTVVAVDVDPAKVDSLNAGKAPLFEPGLDDLLARVLPTGRLRFTTDYAEVAHARACTSCAWAPPSAAARTPPTPPTSTPLARRWPRT